MNRGDRAPYGPQTHEPPAPSQVWFVVRNGVAKRCRVSRNGVGLNILRFPFGRRTQSAPSPFRENLRLRNALFARVPHRSAFLEGRFIPAMAAVADGLQAMIVSFFGSDAAEISMEPANAPMRPFFNGLDLVQAVSDTPEDVYFP